MKRTGTHLSYRRKMQRGFIHVLLLVFAVLGLTMWGASELQHWAEEKQQTITKTSGENLISAREALFNYALLPPEQIQFNNDANRYNAYDAASAGVRIPFRYFSLPCPDVALGGDQNLDGVSDILQANCGGEDFESALQAGSRFGRLPWREEKRAATGNDFNYVRGLGNIDFRDGYGQRLWYAVSPNLIDVIDRTDPAFDRPLNPHYLLRLTTGWLSTYEEINGELLSDRVAVAVIAPGTSGPDNTGARIGEDSLYGGPGITLAAVDAQLVNAYLDPAANYADFFAAGGDGLSLTVRGDVDEASADKTEYLTIEELAADGSEGIAVLENSAQNIYDTIAGGSDGEFLNIVDLMSQHLERYGFLPDPAIYDAGIATQHNRPEGPAAQGTVTVSYSFDNPSPPPPTITRSRTLPFQQGLRMNATVVQSLEVRIADLPPVYLAADTRLALAPRHSELFPPYGLALARLESDLNAISLDVTPAGKDALPGLMTGNHYPVRGLGGLQSDFIEVGGLPEPPQPVPVVQAFNNVLSPAMPFTVILADGAYGYFLGDTLISIVAYPNGKSTADIAALPPHAAKAYIPTGTRIAITIANVSVRMPHTPTLPPGSTFDPDSGDSGEWTIGAGAEFPVRLLAGNDQYLTIAATPNNFPVVVGDSGFMPVEEALVVDDMEGITISLSDQTNAISRLGLPTRFRVNASLLLQPFPPPGRPQAGGYESQANAQPLATPYHLQADTQFTAPAGSRIIYQPGVRITTGESFSFPANSILQIAAGAEIEVEISRDSVLPGGIPPGNGAAQITVITLFYGGFVNIADARMDFSDSNFLSSAQELFDIELRADALMLATPNNITLSGNEVVRPFINRRYTPQAAITLTNAVFSSDSYVRAEFITRPRYLRLPGDDGAGDPSSTRTDKAVASSYNQPREIPLTDLRGLQGLGAAAMPLAYSGSTDTTVSITFDEDSEFFIPPNTPITLSLGMLQHNNRIDGGRAIENIMLSVVLPAGTGFYDRDTNPPLAELTLALPPAVPPTPMYPNLVVMNSPLTLTLAELVGANTTARGTETLFDGLFENRLLLYPESDMYVHTGTVVSLVAAGSIVDLLAGVIYAPVGMQRVKRVAEDLSIRSSDIAHIYNSKAVTLRIGKPTVRFEDTGAAVQVAPPPLSPVTVLQAHYHTFSGYVATPSAANIISAALTLVSDIVLPANSYIQLPPGQDIDFLSDNVGSTGTHSTDIPLADYAHLPPGAVAVIPNGASAMATYQEIIINTVPSPPVTTTMTSPIAIPGPAYLNLNDGGGGAAAFINSPAYLQTSPLVFLTGEARLFDSSSTQPASGGVFSSPAVVTNRIYSYIPPDARLDLHGNMERRIDSGFHTDLLPASSRQFYQDFPLIYAVAPECRRSARLHGSDCAQGEGEGLEFTLAAGEEYVLQEPMEIPAAALITSAYPDVDLAVDVMDIGSDTRRDTGSGIEAILIDGASGMVTFSGGTYTPKLNDKIVVRVDGENYHTELRTYLSPGLAFGAALDGVTYVAVEEQRLTIYNGGYVGDNYGSAAGIAMITMNASLAYGYGADLNQVVAGDKVFGTESSASVVFPSGGGETYTTTLNLANYIYAGSAAGNFTVSLTLSADTYDQDNNNFSYGYGNAGSVLVAQESAVDIDAIVAENNPTEIITVDAATAIPMRSGYLWQGYVPRDAEWALRQNPAMVSVYQKEIANHAHDFSIPNRFSAEPATITLASLMDNRAYLRIQSTVAELNLWGSGLERPESLDAESFTFEQQGLVAAAVTLTFHHKIDTTRISPQLRVFRASTQVFPYYSYGASRHVRYPVRDDVYEDNYLGLIPPPPPPLSFLPPLPRPYVFRKGIFPEILGLPNASLALFNTAAVGSFAELMDSTRVTVSMFNGAPVTIFADVRNVPYLSIRVRVRDENAGTMSTVTAHWRPVVVTNGVTVGGHVRVNFGSNSPLVDSHLGGSSMQTTWVSYYRDGSLIQKEAQFLPHEWIGRFNRSTEPEDGYIDNFMCSDPGDPALLVPATAVFNIPHIDLVGNAPQYRVWPSAERDSAHINNFEGVPPIAAGNSDLFDDFTSATRPDYATVSIASPPILYNVDSRQNRFGTTATLTVVAADVFTVTIRSVALPFGPTDPPDPPLPPPVTVTTKTTLAAITFPVATSLNRVITNTVTVTVTATPPYNIAVTVTNNAFIPHLDVDPADAIDVTTRLDWVFYMDRAYHSTADGVYNSPLPQQSLQFGANFRIGGPAAIVPPFAGNNDRATREIYAERSALMNKLFATPPLHPIYDRLTGDCRLTNDCEALNSNPYWFPIVGGAITFDGLEISLSTTANHPGSDDVRVVFPEPETTVTDVDGNTVTIYAGSIIYPLRNEIHKANRLPAAGGYRLVSDGEVIAHVDTSPAQRRLNYEVRHRVPQAFDSGVFNFAPTRTAVTNPRGPDCIVEPIGFVNPGPYLDLDLRAIARATVTSSAPPVTIRVPAVVTPSRYTFTSDDHEDSALCAASGANFGANMQAMGCYEGGNPLGLFIREGPATQLSVNHLGAITEVATAIGRGTVRFDTQNPYYFNYGVRDPNNIFEEVAWQGRFLNNTLAWRVSVTDLGGSGFTVNAAALQTNPNQALFAGRSYTHEPIRYDGSFNRGHIVGPAGLALLTAYYKGEPVFNGANSFQPYGERSPHSSNTDPVKFVEVVSGVDFTVSLSRNTDARFKNPAAYQWLHPGQHFQPLGVDDIVDLRTGGTTLDFRYLQITLSNLIRPLDFDYATVGVRYNNTRTDVFESLRLAHHINIPANTALPIRDYNSDLYPDRMENFFQFPLGSEAIVVNNDLATWLSSNPYIGLYRHGLSIHLLNNAGDMTLVTRTIADNPIADNTINDAFRRIDVQGKRVVHYQRSESSQSREPFSAVPIHTNVWLRLPEGGRLLSDNGGETIFLPPNSIVNPIYGTYLQHAPPQREAGFAATSVPNNYRTSAQAVVDLPIVRPALILPAGGRLLVGNNGARLQNVQAAAFFSLTPLESVECPVGAANAHSGQAGRVVINQIREGVFASDENYADAATGRVFSFGHPCEWLDDPENTDGDRLFIYRGRRRYTDDNVQVRPTSNDRTYLLGGRLEIGV